MAVLIVLLLPVCGVVSENAPHRLSVSLSQDIAIDVQDSLLTSTFPDRTDDAALAAAVPGLVNKGVRSISLRGTLVRDLRALSAMTGLQVLDLDGTQARDLWPLADLTAYIG